MTTKHDNSRQWPLVAYKDLVLADFTTPQVYDVVLPPGALLMSIVVLTVTAVNAGTTATLTVGDGTTTFVNGVDVTTTGSETVSNTPKYYPSGGTLTITPATTGTAATTGQVEVYAEYVVNGRSNENQR